MKTRYTGIEIISIFNLKEPLHKLRKEGMPCDYLSGRYWYNYDELVRWLM